MLASLVGINSIWKWKEQMKLEAAVVLLGLSAKPGRRLAGDIITLLFNEWFDLPDVLQALKTLRGHKHIVEHAGTNKLREQLFKE